MCIRDRVSNPNSAFVTALRVKVDEFSSQKRAGPRAYGLDDGFYIPRPIPDDAPIWAARYMVAALELHEDSPAVSRAEIAEVVATSIRVRFACGDLGRLTESAGRWDALLTSVGNHAEPLAMLRAASSLRNALEETEDQIYRAKWPSLVDYSRNSMAITTDVGEWAYKQLQDENVP